MQVSLKPTLVQTMHARGVHKPNQAVTYAVMDVTALQLQVTDRVMQEWHLLACQTAHCTKHCCTMY